MLVSLQSGIPTDTTRPMEQVLAVLRTSTRTAKRRWPYNGHTHNVAAVLLAELAAYYLRTHREKERDIVMDRETRCGENARVCVCV